MTIYIPIPLIIIAVAIGVFVFIEINYSEHPAWKKVKTGLQVAIVVFMVLPSSGFVLGMLLGKAAGWDKDSWKTQLTAIVCGFGLPLALLKLLQELNVF
jgi:hypothetical protein